MKRQSRLEIFLSLIVAGLLPVSLAAADYQAGMARVNITPPGPIWLSGYGNRTHVSEGVAQELWAKALALDDGKHGRVVIVTTDLIGLPRSVSDVVAARVSKEHGLDRSQLVLNSSHTHTGPLVKPNLMTMFDLTSDQDRVVSEYAQQLTGKLVDVVGDALKDLAPARVEYGSGTVGFAVNRRQATDKGVKIGVSPDGHVDHSVPVLRITRSDGTLKGVLFGYSCHNTTLTGEFYQISGDYAGVAQAEFERSHPGSTAMFLMLTGGDQNPNPRSSMALVQQHGKSLAEEAGKVAGSEKLQPIEGRIRSAFVTVDLPFAPHERSDFEKMLSDTNPVKVRLAKAMLKTYDERRPIRTVSYPVQAVRLGKEVVLLALGGEIVVDYGLRAKKEYPKAKLIVAGYSNDVMCYIPTKRILSEGGYEAVDSMIYYGQPGPFTPEVEERIFSTIARVMKKVGF